VVLYKIGKHKKDNPVLYLRLPLIQQMTGEGRVAKYCNFVAHFEGLKRKVKCI
jgi:hypothetical protein